MTKRNMNDCLESSAGRNLFGDTVKGLAILLVVLGHAIQYGGGKNYMLESGYFGNILFKWIYSFHMPLFMMISGFYFGRTLERRSLVHIIKTRFTGLVVPIISFSIIKYVIVQIFVNKSINLGMYQCIDTFLHTLWFLWTVLACSLICLVVERIHLNWAIYIFIILMSMVLPNIYNIQYVSFMLPFFIFGLKTYQNGWERLIHNKVIGFVSLLMFAILLCFYTNDSYVYTSGTCVLYGGILNTHQIIVDVYRWAVGFCGSFSILFVMQMLWPSGSITLGKFGLLSMGVYCWQEIACNLYYHLTSICAKPEILWWILSFVVLLISTVGTTMITRRIPIARKILYGGR